MANVSGDAYLLQPRAHPATLSLVIPMYNEESALPFLRTAVTEFMSKMPFHMEVVLINDGSTDATLRQLVDWARQDTRVKVINFSRNFGHQIALTAGLDYATGDAIVTLDADLQDPLSVIPRMIELYCEGYDVIYGQRKDRLGENWMKRCTAWLFYRFMRKFIHKDLPVDSGDFRLLSRPCLSGLQQMRETHRFIRGMIAWVGFPQIAVQYERQARVAGTTKYPMKKMLGFAWTAATSFSILPLKASIWLGVIVTIAGMGEMMHALLAKIFHWYVVPGWASLAVLVSILGGATLVSIGVLGEYVGKLYEQTKSRPLYLVAQTVNIDTASDAAEKSHAAQKW